jgi:hypothetical protein
MFHPTDTKVLTKAREKMESKQSVVVEESAQVKQPGTAAMTLKAASQRGTAAVKVSPQVASQSGRLLAAAAITNFKPGGSRAKRSTQGARTNLVVPPGPAWVDTNPWAPLLRARRGLQFSVRVVKRLLALFRANNSDPVEGDIQEPLTARAMIQIPRQGLLFDPFIQGDIEQEEEQQEEDVHPPGPAPARLGARLQGQQQRDTAQGGGHTVEDEVGRTGANGGEHTEQEDTGEDTGNTGEDAGNAGDTGEDAGEDEEEKQDEEEEKQEEEAVIASQGWQGGRRHPTRVRKKVDKFNNI